MQKILCLFAVLLLVSITHASFAQQRVNVTTLQPLPELTYQEVLVDFSEIPEVPKLETLLNVSKLDEAKGDNALMLDVLGKLIDYNANKLYNEGTINWSLPKQTVVLLINPRLDSKTVKTQFLQVVNQSYDTVKQLHDKGMTPNQIKDYLLTTLK